MSNLAGDLVRRLKDEPNAKVEFELRYVQRDPPASAFAYDLLHLDREVRRAAREMRDGIARGPIEARRRRRPLEIKQGLIVLESHRSDFSFLLEVPPDLYRIILSEPVEFATRVIDLSRVFAAAARQFVLRRRVSDGGTAEQELLSDSQANGLDAEQIVPDKGASGGTVERIQRVRFPDGLEYEFIERIVRETGGRPSNPASS